MRCPQCHYYDITKEDDLCPCCGYENPEYFFDDDDTDDDIIEGCPISCDDCEYNFRGGCNASIKFSKAICG